MFNLSPANAIDLVTSNILSSNKELNSTENILGRVAMVDRKQSFHSTFVLWGYNIKEKMLLTSTFSISLNGLH